MPIGKQVHQKKYLSILKECYKNKYRFLTAFFKWFPAIIKYIEVDNLTYAYTSKLLKTFTLQIYLSLYPYNFQPAFLVSLELAIRKMVSMAVFVQAYS